MRLNSIRVKINLAAFLALAALAGSSGLLMYARMGSALSAEARAAAKRESALAIAYLDLAVPGEWSERGGALYKGSLPVSSLSVVMDRIGTMIDAKITIFHGNKRAATNILLEDGSRAVGTEIAGPVAELVLGRGEVFNGEASVLGESYQAFYRPLYSSGSAVIGMFFIGIPRAAIETAIESATLLFSALVAGVAILSLVLLFAATGRLLRPIGLVAGRLETIAGGAGDLSVELPVASSDEVGRLSGSFNKVMARLRAMIEALKSVSSSGARTSEELASHSQELSSTMAEIAATMRSIDSKNGLLRDEIVGAEGRLAEVESSVRALAGLVGEQSAAVSQSSAAVRQTQAALESIERATNEKRAQTEGLARSAKEGEEAMAEMLSAIADINARAKSISEIMGLLEGIAEQTGLLAMNAAIEAAHAGEAGKGFAVVAEEIRRLADATSENSAIAASTLSGVVESVGSTSSLTERAGALIGGIIRGASEVSGSMEETLGGIREIAEGGRQLTDSLERLVRISAESLESSRIAGRGAADVKESFSSLRSLAEENRAGISETAAGLGEVAEAASALANLSTETSRGMDVLEGEIGRFKTS
ncbi:MAG TPA: methyl-accepting chemotaxis protein [Spirochaetales bacterium]|nr:methyl-accepting chemotaxis protein [Spirochaetales bacterium]HRY54560.1 methyl-accepting chemotaxis protein [Spirochaetia bacterium]